MKKTYTATINLTVSDVEQIIRNHFGLPEGSKIHFKVSDISDDRYGGSPIYSLMGVDVVHEVSADTGGAIKFPPGVR